MLDQPTWILRLLLPCLALGVAGAAVGANRVDTSDAPVRCGIHATEADGTIVLEGQVLSEAAVSGSYRFRVARAGPAGNADIVQGGEFATGADGAATLGKVMLAGSGDDFHTTLEIAAEGVTVVCTETYGGAF